MGSSFPASSVPDLLTVEEAARVLRIGRTKAYELTQAWRDSGGKLGIPVIEIGGLRVPKARLEELIGAPILVLPAAPTEATEPAKAKAVELHAIDGELADPPPLTSSLAMLRPSCRSRPDPECLGACLGKHPTLQGQTSGHHLYPISAGRRARISAA